MTARMWTSAPFLQSLSTTLIWITAICGGIAVVASLFATIASNRASELVQREADVKIAEANAQAQVARLETLRLQEKLAWRRVTPGQRAKLIESLQGKNFEVWTTFVDSDPEATIFRNEIDEALTRAGLKTKYFSGWKVAMGLKIVGPESQEKDSLADAFRRAGLVFTVEGPGSFAKDELVVIVGTKPEQL